MIKFLLWSLFMFILGVCMGGLIVTIVIASHTDEED